MDRSRSAINMSCRFAAFSRCDNDGPKRQRSADLGLKSSECDHATQRPRRRAFIPSIAQSCDPVKKSKDAHVSSTSSPSYASSTPGGSSALVAS